MSKAGITGARLDAARRAIEDGELADRSEPAAEREAEALVIAADELVSEVLRPGRWPQTRTVARFLESDRLERVLALYQRAMVLDPSEPSYPWNLSGVLSRLGLNDLALGYIERALRVAELTGDQSLQDSGAYLAWAETALRAGQDDVAILALAKAKKRDPKGRVVPGAAKKLLAQIGARQGVDSPERHLAEELRSLAS